MQLDLYIDQERGLLTNGASDPSPLSSVNVVTQGDSKDIILHGVKRNPDQNTRVLIPVVDDPIVFTGIKLALAYPPDTAPNGGSFKLRMVGKTVTTGVLTYPITKADFLAAINGLADVTALAATVQFSGDPAPANFFPLTWSNPAITATFEVVENRLAPRSFWRSIVKVEDGIQTQLLKFTKAPVAFCQNFLNPASPAITVVPVRAGTGTQNCVQAIIVPLTALGTVSFSFASNATSIIAVEALNGAADASSIIASALNGIYADGVVRFSVTRPVSAYLVEYIGPLAKTDFPLTGDLPTGLAVQMHDQAPSDVAVGSLGLGGPSIEFALMGQPYLDLIIEIEVTNGEKLGTPIQQKIRLLNDIIDSQMSVAADPAWLEAIDPSYLPYDPAGATITGFRSYITSLGDGSSSAFVVTHNLATQNLHVTLWDSATHQRVPDAQYVTTAQNDSQVQISFADVPNFEWANPPALNEFYVIMSSAVAQDLALPHHTHPISDIVGLQDRLTALLAGTNPLDLWPAIPDSKLPAHVGWYNPDGTLRFDPVPDALTSPKGATLDANRADGGRLLLGQLPLGVPYLDGSGNLVVNLPGPPPITVILLDPSGHVPIGTLPVDPSLWPGLGLAITAALQAGAPLPLGFVPFIIAPVKFDFPSAVVAGSKTTPASLPRAMTGYAVGSAGVTTISGKLPLPSADVANVLWTVQRGATALPVRWRPLQTFNAGALIICDGQQWFEVLEDGGAAYPREMNRELFTLRVSPDMMPLGSRFACSGVVYASLDGPAALTTRGEYKLRIETGVIVGPLLTDITFTPVLDKLVLLSSSSTGHSFGFSVTRPAVGNATAKSTLYGVDTSVTPPTGFDFVVRATLSRFDLEDVIENTTGAAPQGQVHISLQNALASVARITT